MASRPQPMLENLNASTPVFAIKIPVRLIGFLLLGLVIVIMLSLASWSVDDPSLSYATAKHPANWLGFPGAVIADLCFQVFGIAIFVMLIPLVAWGWNLVRRQVPSKFLLRTLAWLGANLLTTGVFAFVAVPPSWPLPTGLGGLVGQSFEMLATVVTKQAPEGSTALVFAMILVAPTLALMWIALGIGTRPAKKSAVGGRMGKAAPAVTPEERDFDAAEGTAFFDVALGGLVHMAYSAQTAFRRARVKAREKRDADAQEWRSEAVEPSLQGNRPGADPARQEQPLVVERRAINIETRSAPSFESDELEYPDDDESLGEVMPEIVPEVRVSGGPPRPPAAVAARVVAPAARPVPGNRLAREAQGSLLRDPNVFELPELSLLAEPRHKGISDEHRPERLEAMARKLEGVLEDFGVKGDIINVRPGPVVTLYELEPAAGIKSSRVISLADDIARSMSAISARVAVVPGRNAIGIELPNENRETVYLREMLSSTDFEKMKGKLPICLGKTIGGEPIIADLARMPHLLIAGTTGSGKSVGINTMILSILYRMTPSECRMIMIDPKMLELSIYDGIPHLLTPVVTDPSKAVVALKWAVREMEDRYRKMSKIGVRNIDGFNQRVAESKAKGEVITRTVQTGFDRETGEAIFESEEFDLEPLPFIVIIVDEMADLMMVAGKDIEGAIQRLAQMARAAGIHIITATQRPSVDVITGTIKANFPTRVSFQVTSKIDSRTILGEQGAEQLLGNGDMLYMAGGGRIRRLHGPFVADGEVERIVAHLKSQGSPDYLDSITADEDDEDGAPAGDDFGGSGDELYDKAVNIVLQDKKASTSYIQRRLAIGYNKAATLIERMEQEGVISQANHAGKREILVGGDQQQY
ncbi:MAG: ftsK/SpoIIIE family protein [Hyphomicrobiales bacterium]|nr:ftsK/SpoIIIE family protein [Hyphomicrobiales bacterium]